MRTGNTHNVNRPVQGFQTAPESPTSPSTKRVKTEGKQQASSSNVSVSLYTEKAKRLALIQNYSSLCFQLFHFKPGQTTPIHNHPNPTEDPSKVVMVECASYVVDGMVNERLYRRLENDQDGNAQAEKTNKEFRSAGNLRVMDNPGTNPPHSIKNAGDKPATTVVELQPDIQHSLIISPIKS